MCIFHNIFIYMKFYKIKALVFIIECVSIKEKGKAWLIHDILHFSKNDILLLLKKIFIFIMLPDSQNIPVM